jgi:hypothetical protein
VRRKARADLTAKLTAIIHVKPLYKTIHRNNENAQDRAARALAALEGTESEREKGVKRGTMFYDQTQYPPFLISFEMLSIGKNEVALDM